MSGNDDDQRGPVPRGELDELADTTSIRIRIRELQTRVRGQRADLKEHDGKLDTFAAELRALELDLRKEIGAMNVAQAEVKIHVKNLTRAFWLVGGAVITGLTAGFLAVLRHLP